MAEIKDLFDKFQPRDFLQDLVSGEHFEFLFPFLLLYALFYTVLSSDKIKLFRNQMLNKPAVAIVSLIISFYAIQFETSAGHSVASLMSQLFPNISTLTILVLTFYIAGSFFGKDFFNNFFGKRTSAFNFFILGGLAVGSVVYYLGIAFGAWATDPHDFTALYNTTIAIAFAIMAISFMIVRLYSAGIILMIVLGVFLYDEPKKFILSYFIDPAVFILIIIAFLLTWLGTAKEKQDDLKIDMREQKETIENYEKRNGGTPLPRGKSRLYDITSEGFENNKKEWDKNYSGESWEK